MQQILFTSQEGNSSDTKIQTTTEWVATRIVTQCQLLTFFTSRASQGVLRPNRFKQNSKPTEWLQTLDRTLKIGEREPTYCCGHGEEGRGFAVNGLWRRPRRGTGTASSEKKRTHSFKWEERNSHLRLRRKEQLWVRSDEACVVGDCYSEAMAEHRWEWRRRNDGTALRENGVRTENEGLKCEWKYEGSQWEGTVNWEEREGSQ